MIVIRNTDTLYFSDLCRVLVLLNFVFKNLISSRFNFFPFTEAQFNVVPDFVPLLVIDELISLLLFSNCARACIMFVCLEARKGQMKKRLRKKSVRNNASKIHNENSQDNSNSSFVGCRNKAKRPKGRVPAKKRARKLPNIVGLDILHQKTLQSTSPQG